MGYRWGISSLDDHPLETGEDRGIRRFARERPKRLIPQESDSFAPLLGAQLGTAETEFLIIGLVIAVAAPGVEHVRTAAGFGIEEFGGGGEALRALLDDGLAVIDDLVNALLLSPHPGRRGGRRS